MSDRAGMLNEMANRLAWGDGEPSPARLDALAADLDRDLDGAGLPPATPAELRRTRDQAETWIRAELGRVDVKRRGLADRLQALGANRHHWPAPEGALLVSVAAVPRREPVTTFVSVSRLEEIPRPATRAAGVAYLPESGGG